MAKKKSEFEIQPPSEVPAEPKNADVPKKERHRCQGRTRNGDRKGEQCGKDAIKGRDFCRFHGGTTKIGPEHHNYKDGRHSKLVKAVTGRLGASVPDFLKAGMQDPLGEEELFSLREDQRVLHAMQRHLMEKLADLKEVPWGEALGLWKKMEAEEDAEKRSGLFAKLGQVLEEGRDAEQIMRRCTGEFRALVQERAEVSKVEAKRLLDLQNVVTVEQAKHIILALVAQIREGVTEAWGKAEAPGDVVTLIVQKTLPFIPTCFRGAEPPPG